MSFFLNITLVLFGLFGLYYVYQQKNDKITLLFFITFFLAIYWYNQHNTDTFISLPKKNKKISKKTIRMLRQPTTYKL